jgi:serine/threonine protein kinase
MEIDMSSTSGSEVNPFKNYAEKFLAIYPWDGKNYYGAFVQEYTMKLYRGLDVSYREKIKEEVRIYEILSQGIDPQFSFVQFKHISQCEQGYIIILGYRACNFKEYIQAQKQLNITYSEPREIYNFLISLAKTLKEMYKKGIACLCINPFNLLFLESKFSILDTISSLVKFSDMVQSEEDKKLVLIYQSPEFKNLNNDSSFDPDKSDVYSLGIILYNLITLEMPTDINEIKSKINSQEHILMARFNQILLNMLEEKPSNRYSMEKVIESLEHLVLSIGIQPLNSSIRLK